MINKQTMELIMEDKNVHLELIDDNNKAYEVNIVNYENYILKFTSPVDNGKLIKLKKGLEIPIQIKAHSCLFSGEVKIIASTSSFFRKKDSSKIIISAELSKLLQQESGKYLITKASEKNNKIFNQRRADFRLNINLEIKYTLIMTNTGKIIETIEHKKGALVDISAGGMCMISPDHFNKDDNLELCFEILGKKFIVVGAILEIIPISEREYRNRIKFIDFDEGDETELASTILRHQQLYK